MRELPPAYRNQPDRRANARLRIAQRLGIRRERRGRDAAEYTYGDRMPVERPRVLFRLPQALEISRIRHTQELRVENIEALELRSKQLGCHSRNPLIQIRNALERPRILSFLAISAG